MTTSIRARLTIAIVLVVAGVLVALAITLYIGVRHAAWQQHDDALTARAHAIAAIAEREDDREGDQIEMVLPTDATYAEVWLPDGAPLVRTAGLGPTDLPHRTGLFDITLPGGRAGRAIGLPFSPRDEVGRPPLAMMLVVADRTDDVDAAVATVRTWFLVLGLVGLVGIAAATAWLLGRGLRPLAKLAGELERIDDRTLATRLPTDGQPAELVVAVRKLNELLARLDASFARERELSANVSHELRTPLAGLRTLLEVTQLAERSPAEYRKAIADALAIVQQLGVLVENLLVLARLDAGQLEVESDDVALRSLVDDCWRPLAEQAGGRALELRNELPASAVLRTDREKLRIVLANLIGNAVEYTAPGGWISVSNGTGTIVDVTDSGPPIPPDQLERIFDRLWRGDTARSATGIHCGIGLPLARSLCRCLGYTLTAATSPAGHVTFRIAMP